MDSSRTTPRGLVSRSLIAAALFAASVVPGWTLGGLVERWTGWPVLDWLITCGWSAAAVYLLAPRASYRHRDAALALVPLVGWYLSCVLSWRVALLPYRDWEPRADELWRARWLTGDLLGFWRADPEPSTADRRDRPGRTRPRPTSGRRPGAPAR
jgi:hypothetical protein